MIETQQATIGRPVSFIGIGLHSGQRCAVTVRPAPVDTGIRFVRHGTDAPPARLPATWDHVTDSHLRTVLANDQMRIATVEHLLAALRGLEIDNARVEVTGPEVPILDGSALPFATLLSGAGRQRQGKRRLGLFINKSIVVRQDGRTAMLVPARHPKITVTIEFDHPAVGLQTFSQTLTRQDFIHHFAAARTFGFAEELEPQRARGLIRGASLQNAILIRDGKVANAEGLRFENELARHKALDVVGDLCLASMPVIGHYIAHRPGHTLTVTLLRELMRRPELWSIAPLSRNDDAVTPSQRANDHSRPGT